MGIIQNGNTSIIGLMIESHLKGGNQPNTGKLADLEYGVSITDGCLSFEETAEAIREFNRRERRERWVFMVPERRPDRMYGTRIKRIELIGSETTEFI